MSAQRGRPPEHGCRQLAADLAVVKSPRTRQLRPSRRTQKAVARLQVQLDANPIATVRDGLIDTVSRLTVLAQTAEGKCQAYLDGDQPDRVQGVGKLAYWAGNRLDRNREMLLALEAKRADSAGDRCGKCGAAFGSFGDYVQHRCPSAPQATEETMNDDA